jgi:hypothetical protein
METRVVNMKTEPWDIYIGRKWDSKDHFGNPFSHLSNIKNTIKVATRNEAVEKYRQWLMGLVDNNIEPERRQWILNNLHLLQGKKLGCFCHPKNCHGNILKELVENKVDPGVF